MRKLSRHEVVFRQQEKKERPRLPFVIVLNDIRSLYNVGSIFRSADGAGVSHVYLCGITGYPPNDRIAKTALGAQEFVPWSHHPDARAVAQKLKGKGYQLMLLEQTNGSIDYQEYEPQPPVALILGNEIEGVSSSLIEYGDGAIEIAMEGSKNSLNVAVAFGIVAFHIRNRLAGKVIPI